MRPEFFQEQFRVSDEVMARLRVYHALLVKWQKAINLVSPKTIDEIWGRHFADSAQLFSHVPDDVKTLADLGSGAGFPGLVLAIMSPDLEVHLIESDERKAQFLRTVSRETGAGVIVHDARIERVACDIWPDIVTARALASLGDLLRYCQAWVEQNPDTALLFLKGQKVSDELSAAQKRYDFSCESYQSVTSPESQILFIKHIKQKP